MGMFLNVIFRVDHDFDIKFKFFQVFSMIFKKN